MSDTSKSSGVDDAANTLGIIAAIFCAFLGYSHGEWPGAVVAAIVAYGGVRLAFAAVGLALRLMAGGLVLLLMVAALKNRWDWLLGLGQ